MSFLDRFRAVRDIAVESQRVDFSSDQLPVFQALVSGSGYTVVPPTARVAADEAMSVPAVKRARELICSTLGGLPLTLYDTQRISQVSNLLAQPEAPRAVSITMAWTYQDLLFEGLALWRRTRNAWDGYPDKVERISRSRYNIDAEGRTWIDGKHVGDEQLIRFESPNAPLLVAAARAIRKCLLLDRTAAMYADNPYPLAYMTPKDGVAAPDSEKVQAALVEWDEARREFSTAWVPEWMEYNAVEPLSPKDMQLVEAQQYAATEVANATGLHADYLNAPVNSETYANTEQRRQDLIDFVLAPYMHAVEGRLSMPDVTKRGYYVKTNLDGFLRGDTKTRMEVYTEGLANGAYTTEEIRALEDRPALPVEASTSEEVQQ